MKTTRTYLSGCTWCNGTGFIKIPNPGFMTSALTGVCPVCNGAKTVIVTEETEIESKRVSEVSDEDIQNAANEYEKEYQKSCHIPESALYGVYVNEDYFAGAKAMRDGAIKS